MFEEMLAAMEEQRKADSVPFLGDAAEHARYLKEKAALLAREDNLQVGDAVVWKPGLKGLDFPAEGGW